jgi:hypothetical protein
MGLTNWECEIPLQDAFTSFSLGKKKKIEKNTTPKVLALSNTHTS